MSWENILKVNDATSFVRSIYMSSKRITGEDDVKRMAKLLVQSVQNFNLESIQRGVRTALEETFLNPTFVRDRFANDPVIRRMLENVNLSIDDVDWDEAFIPVLAIYDEKIDNLTEEDLT